MSERITPLGDRVLVRPIEQASVSEGGVVIPDTAKNMPQRGSVIEIGEAAKRVSTGDQVVYSRFAGTEIELDKVEHLILAERDILAVVQ